MDAGVMDEETSTISKGPPQMHGWDSNSVALVQCCRKPFFLEIRGAFEPLSSQGLSEVPEVRPRQG